jgi:hypothetical protein
MGILTIVQELKEAIAPAQNTIAIANTGESVKTFCNVEIIVPAFKTIINKQIFWETDNKALYLIGKFTA